MALSGTKMVIGKTKLSVGDRNVNVLEIVRKHDNGTYGTRKSHYITNFLTHLVLFYMKINITQIFTLWRGY